MNYHFKNLVFEGGGVRGIAYVGALEVLDNEGILKNIKRVAGTSAGAMVAVLVGLNYTASEISEVLWSLNFQKFLDDSFGCARDFDRLINEYGWYKGDFFRNLMADLIKDKTGNGEATFKDLAKAKKYRDIYLIGADLSTGFSKVFCNDKTPNVKVADAARVSMSIPLFFRAVNGINNDGHIYVDGGLLDNYPIKVFDRASYVSKQKNERTTEYYEKTNKSLSKKYGEIDRYVYNKETLGFRLDSKEEIEKFINPNMVMPVKNDIKSLFSYTKALVTTLIDFQNNVHLHSDDWQRTIYIDTLGVNSTDFGISDSKKKKLVESGITNTQKYFMWYNNEEEKANK
ncbi:MAG: patatin-like phospholipase family protein [Bacteroidales bacterium]|nr:patatin-like phospholipase family protein [Bacteroidales bacterium]